MKLNCIHFLLNSVEYTINIFFTFAFVFFSMNLFSAIRKIYGKMYKEFINYLSIGRLLICEYFVDILFYLCIKGFFQKKS